MARRKRKTDDAVMAPPPPAVAGGSDVGRPTAQSGWADPALTTSLYVGWGWMMLTLAGVMLLIGDGVLPGGRRLGVTLAVFHAVSASTLTGYTHTQSVEEFTTWGRGVMLGLTLSGALAVLTIGGLAAKRVARLAVRDSTLLLTTLALLGGAMALSLLFRPAGDDLVGGLLSFVSAAANSGLHTTPPDVIWPQLHTVLLPLAYLGGLGPVVVIDAWLVLTRKGHRLSTYSRLTLSAGAAVFLLLTGMFYLTGPAEMGAGGSALARATAVAGSVASGWGVPVEYANAWPRAVPVLAVLAGATGLAVGAASGGVGATTLAVVVSGLVRGGRGKAVGRLFFLSLALAVAFAGLAVGTYLLLLTTEPQLQADRLLLLAVGAPANASISDDAVSVVGPGLFVLSLAMLAGRVLTLTAVWAMAVLGGDAADSTQD